VVKEIIIITIVLVIVIIKRILILIIIIIIIMMMMFTLSGSWWARYVQGRSCHMGVCHVAVAGVRHVAVAGVCKVYAVCIGPYSWKISDIILSRGFIHLAALGLDSMVLHYMAVNTVILVGLTGMHKTGCSGETRLVLHVPSSSWARKH